MSLRILSTIEEEPRLKVTSSSVSSIFSYTPVKEKAYTIAEEEFGECKGYITKLARLIYRIATA